MSREFKVIRENVFYWDIENQKEDKFTKGDEIQVVFGRQEDTITFNGKEIGLDSGIEAENFQEISPAEEIVEVMVRNEYAFADYVDRVIEPREVLNDSQMKYLEKLSIKLNIEEEKEVKKHDSQMNEFKKHIEDNSDGYTLTADGKIVKGN